MTALVKTLNMKYNEKFFELLAKILEKEFPKGEKCPYCNKKLPCRSKALVLNAYANIYFRQLLMEYILEKHVD